MPQAALPDLNTQWIIDVREVWTALKNQNYSMLFGSLFSINALLPKEYQIEIDDKKYYDEVNKQGICIVCQHCSNEYKRQDIQVKDVLVNYNIAVITGRKTEKIWSCKSCTKDNILSKSKMIHNILPQPCYLKVVPNPPNRKSDLSDRQQYHKNVEKWALQFLNELQHQMSLFRLEYRPREDEELDNYVGGGEELDI